MVRGMSFVNMGALAWLIPLAGAIIVLYLLKMRRKDIRVPATFLWPPLIYEIRANALFQKLKFSWLLLLQLLAICFIIFALSRPQIRQQGLGGAVTVIVLDSSASMAAKDIGSSRFDKAVSVAQGIIDGVRSGDRVALIEAGPNPRVVFPMSSDAGKMRQALKNVEQTDAETDVGEALRLAATITAKQEHPRIVLLSDGVFPEVQNFSAGKAELVFDKIGDSGRNMAISALGIANTDKGRQLFVGVKNYGIDPNHGTLTLLADGKSYDSFDIDVKPGQTEGRTRPAPPAAKVIEARLDSNDYLKSDNYAVALTDPGASLKVLIVGPGDYFLERALALDPRVLLDKSPTLPSEGEWDIVVFDGVPEQPTKARGVITFAGASPSSPVRRVGSLAKPAFASAEQDPLMKSVDIESTYIDNAEKVEARSEAQVMATFKDGSPAVAVSRANGRRKVYVAFEPLQSDFPLQVGFPIFLANALEYVVPKSEQSKELAVTAGRTFAIPSINDKPLPLAGPTGKMDIPVTAGRYVVRDTKLIGEYRLGDRRVFASMRSEIESKIAPADQVLIGNSKVKSAGSVLRLADLWRWLLVAALLVLAGEWWLFARRS
jgi:Ca-activated chloride channel family protein